MPASEHWRRWIHASVADYLSSVALSNSIPSLVEGVDTRDETFMNSPDRVEIRVNGPFTRRLGTLWSSRVIINVLVSSYMGEVKDAYKFDRTLGVFHNAMDKSIECLKLGTGVDDDGTHLGCLIPLQDTSNPIRVLDFGIIDPTDKVRQGMVAATYEIEISS